MEQQESLAGRVADRIGASPAEVVGLAALCLVGALGLGGLWLAQRPAPVEVAAVDAPVLVGAELLVHVTGEVRTPGVVRVRDGARVVDVVELAGGATPDADLASLNLARLVTDGEQVVVRSRVSSAGDGGSSTVASAFDEDGVLDLNLATAADFEELPGIGPVLAERIVAHRERQGRFASVGELRAVSGIGEKTFQALAPLVRV